MERDAVSIEDEPGSIRLSWSTMSHRFEQKLLLALLLGLPSAGALIVILTKLSVDEVATCIGRAVLLGLVVWLLAARSTRVLLDRRGATLTVRKPLWGERTSVAGGPINLRIAPLFGSSQVLGGTPSQFMVAVMPANVPFTIIETIVLSETEAARMKEAVSRAGVPGLVLLEEHDLQDEFMPDCRVCGYDLVGLTGVSACPECGMKIDAGHQRSLAELFARKQQR